MTAKQMWEKFSSENNVSCEYDAWSFGDEPDRLAKLVYDGIKTATSSGYDWYAYDAEELPEAGAYSVVLDSKEQAVCIIRNTRVYITTFEEVGTDHAWKEGEGDRSLAYWRTVHERFFRECDDEAGVLFFHNKMKVVCEEFEKVYP